MLKTAFLFFVFLAVISPVTATAADFTGEWTIYIDAEGVYEDGSINNVSDNLKVLFTKDQYGNLQGKVYGSGVAIGTAYLFVNSNQNAELTIYLTNPVVFLMSNYTMTISCKFFLRDNVYMFGVMSGSFDEDNIPLVLFHGRAYMYRPSSSDGGKG